MLRILLTGARAPVTLDLARQFHRSGHAVYLADTVRCPLARPTRAVRGTFRIAPPVTDPARFVEDLLTIVRRCNIDVLIPNSEEIFFIAARLDAFAGLVRVFAEPLPRLAVLHSKWEFIQRVMALETAASAPETRLLKSVDDLMPWTQRLEPPDWVFKPVYSRFASRTLIGPTPAELNALVPSDTDPWVAQRRIRGQEYSTYSVVQAGQIRAHVGYRSEYRAGKGSGIYFIPHCDPRIQSFVQQFVKEYAYTGQIGFDFIEDIEGKLFVLECNPRATSGLHLLHSEPLADAFLETSGPLLSPVSSKPAMLSAIMMLYLLQTVRSGPLWTLYRNLLRARDILFHWTDPLPVLAAPITLAEIFLKAWWLGKPMTTAATFDIEWNGEPL